jgi:hypothetical protein
MTSTKQLVFIETESPQTSSGFDVLIGEGISANSNNGIRVNDTSSQSDMSLEVDGHVIAKKFRGLSDVRLKSNIENVKHSLELIKSLTGKCYNLKDDVQKSYGLIAQDVETILPDIVETNSEGFKSIAYIELIPFIIEAIKELNEKLEYVSLRYVRSI